MQGRPRCKDSKFFTYLEKTPKKHRYYVECTKCREAHIADPNEPAPELMKSRPEVFRKHLDVCQPRREDPAPVSEEGRRLPPTQWTTSLLAELGRLLVVFQHSNRLADLFIENDATVALLTFLCPGISAVMPSRRVLGGRMLRDVARQCAEKEIRELKGKQEYYGGRVNLLSDVWQNVKKRHVLACQLSLFGATHTFAMVQVGSRHDGLVIAEELENQIELAIGEKHRWVIGACVTDNAGQCGRARRVLALRWPNIVFLHCFAHAVNNLVKSACFASLLRVKTALIAFHTTWEEDSEFPEVLRVLGDQSFWKQVETAEQVIRPLSYASYKLQRDENTLADVVDCFGKILRGFTKFEEYRDELIKCVEQRWAECEQPLFILAYFLHPDYFEQAKELATTPLTRNINVAHFSVYYCRRLLGVENPGRLFGDLLAWREGLLASGIPLTGFRCAADYWHTVDQELEDSAFMDYFLEDIFDDEFEREFQRDMAEQVRRQRRGEARVHINGLEAIERKEKTPFPKTNDMDFPQEKLLTGLRGTKIKDRLLVADRSGIRASAFVPHLLGVLCHHTLHLVGVTCDEALHRLHDGVVFGCVLECLSYSAFTFEFSLQIGHTSDGFRECVIELLILFKRCTQLRFQFVDSVLQR
ncbi:hypothetical protein ATCC90586_006914 [Pythium insidiosum]|nr:hypothetical protein ATCC90586_006914 [Pythium insidiosum]